MARVLGRRNRKRVGKAKRTKAKLTKVVKSIVNKVSETKHYNANWINDYLNGAMKACNLTFAIAQGTSGSQRIGDKIYLKGVSVKVVQSTTLTVPVSLHYAIIGSDDEITGNNTTVTASDYVKNAGIDSDLWRLDPERMQILKKGVVRIRPVIDSAAEKKNYRTFYTKMNRNFQYNPASGYARFKNYYLLTWAAVSGGGLNNTRSQFEVQVYFTDV